MSYPSVASGLRLASGSVAVRDPITSAGALKNNTAGTDLTLRAGRGTGTAAGGKVIFQTSPVFRKYTDAGEHSQSAKIADFISGSSSPATLLFASGSSVVTISNTATYSGTTIADGTVLLLRNTSGQDLAVRLSGSLANGASSFKIHSGDPGNSEAEALAISTTLESAPQGSIASVRSVTTNSADPDGPNSLETAMEIDHNKKVRIFGDLEVDGVTVQVDSVVSTVDDPLMVLGKNNQHAVDLGLVLIRSGASDNKAIFFDESDDYFKVAGVGSEDGTSVNISAVTPDQLMVGKLAVDSSSNHIDVGSGNLVVTSETGAVELESQSSSPILLDAGSGAVVIEHSSAPALELGSQGSVNKLSADSSGNVSLAAAGDITLDFGGAELFLKDGGVEIGRIANDSTNLVLSSSNDMLFKHGDSQTEVMRIDDSASSLRIAGSKKIEFTDENAFIHHDGTDLKISDDADINLVAGVDVLLDAAGSVILDSDAAAGTLFKDGGASYMSVASGSAGPVIKPAQTDGDIVFAEDGGTEVFRLDNDAQSLLMAGQKKIEFGTANAFIHHDGTDLKLSDDADINLVAGADVLIDAATTVILDSAAGDVHFKDNGTSKLLIDMDGTSEEVSISNGTDGDDLVFKVDAGSTEIFRVDDSASSLLMAGTKKIEFAAQSTDRGAYISRGDAVDKVVVYGGAADAAALLLSGAGDSGISVKAGSAAFTLESRGTSADAIKLTALASGGGVNIAAPDASSVLILGNSSANTYVRVTNDGSTAANQKVELLNTGGSADDSIGISSTAGHITIKPLTGTSITEGSPGSNNHKVIIGGHIEPSVGGSFNLGTLLKPFANVHTGDLHLTNDRGSWTLIEETDFIGFRNNHTGQRFRMLMEDITGTGTYGPGNDGEM